MSREQHWMVNDALGLLMQLSRVCCLAPVRFVEISTDNFIYISRPLQLFSIIISFIIQSSFIYFIYLIICIEKGNYRFFFVVVLEVGVTIVFVSYAVSHSETRIKNYMTCLTKLKKALRELQSTEEYYIKKWHVLIMFIAFSSGTTFTLLFISLVYNGAISPTTLIWILEITMSVVVQQQFLYFSLYVSFVLKIIKQQLQEELSKIKSYKNGKLLGNFITTGCNIPVQSINKAIDMIGMADQLFPDVLTTGKQKIAQRIHQINDCYILTCEVLREFSSSNDILLFLQLIASSFQLVFSSYEVILLFHEDGLFEPVKLIARSLKIFMLAITLIMIVQPCHVTHETILDIRYVVSEMMCYVTSKNDPVFNIMEGFYHQLVLNDISYTALGIYKIGRPLATSILGLTITILIAIFQI